MTISWGSVFGALRPFNFFPAVVVVAAFVPVVVVVAAFVAVVGCHF